MNRTNLFPEVPRNPTWPGKRARFLFRERREKAGQDAVQLTASQRYGVISQSLYQELSGNRVTAALAGTENFQRVVTGDFVISLRTFEGGIEYAYEDGCISPAYTVLTPSNEVQPGFFRYVLRSGTFLSVLQTVVTGIRDGKSVKFKDFADLVLPLPDLETQKRIADFLDRETTRIDQLIEKKQRLVELLEEKYRGELQNALFDPVGEERQGDWRLVRLKHLAQRISKGTTPTTLGASFEDAGIRFIRAENIFEGRVLEEPRLYISEETNNLMRRSMLEDQDILVVIAGATTGKIGVIQSDQLPANLNQAVSFVRLWDRRMSCVVAAALQTGRVHEEIWLSSVQAAQPNLAMEDLGNLTIPIPPECEIPRVEKRITSLNAQNQKLKSGIVRSIDVLHIFRSALITAAVTGQIDVDSWSRHGGIDQRLEKIEEEMRV